MSMLGRLRTLFAGPVEKRSALGGWEGAFLPMATASGMPVNPTMAENLSASLACISVIATGMASLPAYVYRRAGGVRTEAPTHPVTRLIRAPNPHQTWPDMVEWMMGQVLLRGNALLAIDSDGAGRPVALWPIPWQNVQPMLLASGRLAYDVVAYTNPWGGAGQPRRLLSGEVFHLKDRSDDGLIGRSRISRAPETIGNALALQNWTGSMWLNGATPAGVLSFANSLNPEQYNRIRESFTEKFTGTWNARRPLILEQGAQWQSVSVSPEDAEVLASRRFTVEELARLFQVPPPLIQDYSRNTFTNAATAGLWFAQFTLAPWATKIEAEFRRALFSSGTYELEIDLSGLMRGDYTARWAAYAVAIDKGILTPDEIREAEGYNPRGTVPAPGEAEAA